MNPMTRQELDVARCMTPGCNHESCEVFLHGRCHPHAAVEANYTKGTGILTVRCARCKLLVAHLQIARERHA
jgi:hypothetical protein